MAKAKAKPKGKAKGRPKGSVTEKRRTRAVQVRASDAWKEWVSKYARIRQLSEADLINQALITMAKIDGIDPPPSR